MGRNPVRAVSRYSSHVVALVVALVVSMAGVVGTVAPASAAVQQANVKKACKSLDGLQSDLSDLSGSFSADSFDEKLFKQVGAAFAKAARSAPKNVKGTLKQLGKLYTSIGNADNAIDAGLRFSKDAQQYAKAVQKFAKFYATKCIGTSGTTSGASRSGSGGGTLVLADETVTLTSSNCYLKSQTAAGEDIELTAQASGTNAAGDDVTVDFTRYAESSSFAGDDITVHAGALGASDATDLAGRLDRGAVDRSGDTFSVEDAEMSDQATGETTTISFEIEC